jgi:two-component system cell cycle sensor histidine kinase PleC
MKQLNSYQIRHLAHALPPIGADATGEAVYEMFSRDPDLFCLPVVEGRRPVGLVNRTELTLKLASRFGRPLYERRPIVSVMDPAPLIVDGDMILDDLSSVILAERPGALLTGFIVTDGGEYLGIGTALSILRMRMAHAELRQKELDRARREAESSSRSQTEFLANMSHELRTPLNAIIGFSEILTHQLFGPLGNERYLQYVHDIHRSGTHLMKVIGDILDLSKIEAGKLELSPGLVDPIALVNEATRMVRCAADDKGIALILDVKGCGGPIEVDETKLIQVLINLLSNAVKFTQQGGRILVVAAHAVDGSFSIGVADSGIGMYDDEIEIALEPFGQVEPHLNRRHGGTGLGLPLAKSLVELHGGHIEIESEKGVGTTVTIHLPAALSRPERSVA